MASFWFYLGIAFVSCLTGGIFTAGIYILFSWLSDRRIKKNVPKTKDELANPGNVELIKKEVVEDDREQYAKFREFEKLRRIAEGQPVSNYGSDTREPSSIQNIAPRKSRFI